MQDDKSLRLDHIAVCANSEEHADRFFGQLLGLQRTRDFSVPAGMMLALFGIEREIRVLRYAGGGTDVEVFITDDDSRAADRYTHSCLAVPDREAFCRGAQAMGLAVARATKASGDGTVVFASDFHGNRYEIK